MNLSVDSYLLIGFTIFSYLIVELIGMLPQRARGAGRGRRAGQGGAAGTLSGRGVTPAARRRGARKVTLAAFAGCRRPGPAAWLLRGPSGCRGEGLGRSAGLRLGPRGQRNFSPARRSLLAAGGVAGGRSALVECK